MIRFLNGEEKVFFIERAQMVPSHFFSLFFFFPSFHKDIFLAFNLDFSGGPCCFVQHFLFFCFVLTNFQDFICFLAFLKKKKTCIEEGEALTVTTARQVRSGWEDNSLEGVPSCSGMKLDWETRGENAVNRLFCPSSLDSTAPTSLGWQGRWR